MKKIRTVLPTTSNNNYIPNNVLALNVKDNNAYYKHNNKLFQLPLNNNSDKPSYEDIIYGIKFKVLDKSVYEAHKDELKGIYSEGVYSERVAYKVTVINHFDTGVQEIVHAEFVENNKRWEPCLDGEGGINDFEDVYPFCYMKKYINRGDTYKLEIDKLIEFDNITVTQEEKENGDHYTCLPVFFKSVVFSLSHWYWNLNHEDYEIGYNYYFMSDKQYKVNIPNNEENSDVWDSGECCLSDFYCVESHRTLSNLSLNDDSYLDVIFISSYNINDSETGLQPGNVVKPVFKTPLTTTTVVDDYAQFVPHRIYETYLEYIWSIKLGTPCLQGYLNNVLTKLYNKKINYLSYTTGARQQVEGENYYKSLYSCNFQFYIEPFGGLQNSRVEVRSFIDFNERDSSGNPTKITLPLIIRSKLDEKLTSGQDIILFKIRNDRRQIRSEKNKIQYWEYDSRSSKTYIVFRNNITWEEGMVGCFSDFYLETGNTALLTKDGLYNNIMLMDNIENPHIFSKYPTFIGKTIYRKDNDGNFGIYDDNFMSTSEKLILHYPDLQLTDATTSAVDGFILNNIQNVYSKDLYNGEFNLPSFVNKYAKFGCNITGKQIAHLDYLLPSLSQLHLFPVERRLYVFRRLYYMPGFLNMASFWNSLPLNTYMRDAISSIEINIEHKDYLNDDSHVQVISPEIDVYSETNADIVNFGLSRRILLP